MNPFEMVVIIVIVACAAGVAKDYFKNRENARKSRKDPATEEQIRRLEERIEALETIVTDSRYQLDREFRNLRD